MKSPNLGFGSFLFKESQENLKSDTSTKHYLVILIEQGDKFKMSDVFTKDQIDFIVDLRKEYLEAGFDPDSDELIDFFLEEGYNEAEAKAALDFYMELEQLGPIGMLEEYPELDWSEDFRNEYGYYEDDEDFDDDAFDEDEYYEDEDDEDF